MNLNLPPRARRVLYGITGFRIEKVPPQPVEETT